MAYNKEYVIFVLDVRQSTPEEFKQKSIKCCAEVMKRKICCAKKDFLSFVLVGTERTYNDVNTNESHDGYLNIVQYPCEMELPSWQLLMNFYQFVNETSSEKGEWLDGLVVAFSMLKSGSESKKVQRLRIVLFYDFNDGANSYECFGDITKSLLEHNVDLTVIAPNIAYVDNEANNFLPQAIFVDAGKRSQHQVENEKYATRLVFECNANLCNLKEAEYFINKTDNKRPWTWNNELRIGTAIAVKISGIIAAKNESVIKLKKVWNEVDEKLTREWGYFIDGNQITPNEDDLIEGYMLGGTPIPFDESAHDDDKIKLPPGLTVMGFVPRDSIRDEYFSGDSVYLVLHQRGSDRSAKIIDALVRVLLKAKRAMLCWKVFSEKFNTPRIVVLIPNEIVEDSPASFYMYEMAYHDQYQYFEFPKLASKNTECSKEQLDAIDNLIDSMDLTMEDEDGQVPRETRQKDLLPFDKVPHVFERNFMDLMERKILCKASEDDEFFDEILKDKNFAEIFWKVPEKIEEKAKEAAKEVKRVFPLQVTNDWLEKVKAEENVKLAKLTQTLDDNEPSTSNTQLTFDHVRSVTPADDFEKLLKTLVFPIQNSTQRDVKFNHYASQMRAVIKDLIFKPQPTDINVDKIIAALTTYRKRCFIFNAFDEYNTWISSIKTEVVNRRMIQFWQYVIVANELGLCFVGVLSLDEQIKEKEFYCLGIGESEADIDAARLEMDDSEMDNLLANLP